MRTLIFALLLGLGLGARAEDWRTNNGTIYRDVKVLSHDASTVTITHAEGGGKVMLKDLPPELQLRFGFNTKEAAASIQAAEESRRASCQAHEATAREELEKEDEDQRKRETGVNAYVRVIQVLDDGLLCATIGGDESLTIFVKTDSSEYVDGDKRYFFLMPVGRYQYTSTGGSRRTVSKWIVTSPPAPEPVASEPVVAPRSMGSINDDILSGAFNHHH